MGFNAMNVTPEMRLVEAAKYDLAYQSPVKPYIMAPWRSKRFDDYLESIKGRGYTSMLDVGCGVGVAMGVAKARGYAVHGVEILDRLCELREVTKIDGAHKLPFAANSFDVVVSTDVMEHLLPGDVQAVLTEMARVAANAIHLTISHKSDKCVLHMTVQPREWWIEQIHEAIPQNIFIALESDKLTPPVKMPCTHLEVRLA